MMTDRGLESFDRRLLKSNVEIEHRREFNYTNFGNPGPGQYTNEYESGFQQRRKSANKRHDHDFGSQLPRFEGPGYVRQEQSLIGPGYYDNK